MSLCRIELHGFARGDKPTKLQLGDRIVYDPANQTLEVISHSQRLIWLYDGEGAKPGMTAIKVSVLRLTGDRAVSTFVAALVLGTGFKLKPNDEKHEWEVVPKTES